MTEKILTPIRPRYLPNNPEVMALNRVNHKTSKYIVHSEGLEPTLDYLEGSYSTNWATNDSYPIYWVTNSSLWLG